MLSHKKFSIILTYFHKCTIITSERINIAISPLTPKKLNKAEGNEQNQVKISNRFIAPENLRHCGGY
jgi:hypothetical protein